VVEDSEVLCRWAARKMQPIVLLWVALVFLALIVVAYFAFHSVTGVMALFLGAVAYLTPLIPMVLNRLEYRLTEQKIEKRTFGEANPSEFADVVELGQLSHVVPIRFGFKFYKPLDERNVFRRFWKLHVTDEYSGEVRVEKADQELVFSISRDRGVAVR